MGIPPVGQVTAAAFVRAWVKTSGRKIMCIVRPVNQKFHSSEHFFKNSNETYKYSFNLNKLDISKRNEFHLAYANIHASKAPLSPQR
jgi:hypothetical protein